MASPTRFRNENGKQVIERDVNSVLDYIWPWGEWLTQVNDSIAAHEIVDVQGVTVDADDHTESDVVVWLSGGTVSRSKLASVTVRITTTAGRVEDRTAYFRNVQR
jgi:hypothetical protein